MRHAIGTDHENTAGHTRGDFVRNTKTRCAFAPLRQAEKQKRFPLRAKFRLPYFAPPRMIPLERSVPPLLKWFRRSLVYFDCARATKKVLRALYKEYALE